MRKKFRQVYLFIMIFSMIIGTFYGCSKNRVKKNSFANSQSESLSETTNLSSKTDKKEDNSKDQNLIGGYVESQINLPSEYKAGYEITTQVENDLLTMYFNRNGDPKKFVRLTLQKDGSWKEEDLLWGKDVNQYNNSMIMGVICDANQDYYLLTYDYHKTRYYLLKITKDGLQEIPAIPKSFQSSEIPKDLTILSNNNIMYISKDTAYCFNQKGEEQFFIDQVYSFKVVKDKIIVYRNTENEFEIYDLDGKKSAVESHIELNPCTSMESTEDELYIINNDGIYCYNIEGSIQQKLVDKLELSCIQIRWMFPVAEGDSTTFYISDRKDNFFYCYRYDNELLVTKRRKLKIYSVIDDNSLIKACVLFRHLHPEVDLEFETIPGLQFTNEMLLTLTTDLYAGVGPDLLCLDNLPIADYVENGVLEDISDMTNQLVNQNQIIPNLLNCYTKEDKCYYLPVRVIVPMVYGPSEVIDHMDTLSNLKKFMNQNPERRLFDLEKSLIACQFMKLYYKEIIGEDGRLNEEAFRKYIDIVQIFWDKEDDKELEYAYGGSGLGDAFGTYVNQELYDDLTRIKDIRLYEHVYFPYHKQTQVGAACKIWNNTIVGECKVGVNHASKNKDIATEFLQLLFSEEVQNDTHDAWDGIPVNPVVLNQMRVELPEEKPMIMEGYGNILLRAAAPTKEQLEDYHQQLTQVDQVFTVDEKPLIQIVYKVQDYLQNKIGYEELLHTIKSYLTLYYSE